MKRIQQSTCASCLLVKVIKEVVHFFQRLDGFLSKNIGGNANQQLNNLQLYNNQFVQAAYW